jgi:bis(5'-nucleosyl)-tetraphosphatase (symmetrical)
VSHGVRPPHRNDTLDDILPRPTAMPCWTGCASSRWRCASPWRADGACRRAAAWTAAQTLALAAEVEAVLRGRLGPVHAPDVRQPAGPVWGDGLAGAARLRVIVNALTRLRFCTPDGRMEFATKEGGAAAAPPGHLPWFDVPGRRTAGEVVAFGHWSTLGWLDRPDLISLDTGCVWGGCLSAVRLGADGHQRELIQVRCEQPRNRVNDASGLLCF